MERDLADLLQQECQVSRFIESDAYGQAVYGDAAHIACRTASRTRMIRDASGKEVVSTSTTWIEPNGVTVRDKITLPDGSSPKILQVQNFPDETGQIHHQKIHT